MHEAVVASNTMLKQLLNCPERITYHRLSEVCSRRSAQVYAKVRLADVLPIERSGLSEALFEFALQAHYDFVITDLTQRPLFAVEFDGPSHNSPIQYERDAKKDELSSRFGLPLVRIFADDLLRSERCLDRLTEVAEQWFDGFEYNLGIQVEVERDSADPSFVQDTKVAEMPTCPLCGAGMIDKNGKYGPFLSCARYPDCNGSCDLPKASTRSDTEEFEVNPPTAISISRKWLTSGIVLVGLVFVLLLVVISRSSDVGPPANEPSALAASANTTIVPAPPNVDKPRAVEAAPIAAGAGTATSRQMQFLAILIKRRGWDSVKRDTEMALVLGHRRTYLELSKAEATELITAWDDRKK